MKLGVIMALWRRQELTRLCLRRIARAARGVDAVLVAVTDEEDNGRAAREHGFEVVERPNRPLGAKHNAAVWHLRGRVDAVVVLGSDDWVCDQFFPQWATACPEAPLFGLYDTYQVCLRTRRALYFEGYRQPHRRGDTIGAGRRVGAEVLEALDWQPWEPDVEKSLDWSMRQRMEQRGFRVSGSGVHQAQLGVRMIGSIKGRRSLTSFDEMLRQSSMRAWGDVLAPFPPDEVRELEALTG